MLALPRACIEAYALKVVLEDKVDHACNRVGAVDRRSAACNDLNALDHGVRDSVGTDKVGTRPVRSDAPAIDECQSSVRSKVPKVNTVETALIGATL